MVARLIKKIIGENWWVRFSNAPCRGCVFSPPLSWPYVYTRVPKLYTDDYDAIVYGRIVDGILYNATVLNVVPQILANVSFCAVYSSDVIYSGGISPNRWCTSVVGISTASRWSARLHRLSAASLPSMTRWPGIQTMVGEDLVRLAVIMGICQVHELLWSAARLLVSRPWTWLINITS